MNRMPYELSFEKPLEIGDRDPYFNECCVGGDVVSAQLLPTIRAQYEKVRADQEDWGWFIWFRRGPVQLAVDIFCDEPERGEFRMHVTSRIRRFLLPDPVRDTPELEALKDSVVALLADWIGTPPRVVRLDADFAPVGDGG